MALFICDFANKKCLSGWDNVSIKGRVGLTAGSVGCGFVIKQDFSHKLANIFSYAILTCEQENICCFPGCLILVLLE